MRWSHGSPGRAARSAPVLWCPPPTPAAPTSASFASPSALIPWAAGNRMQLRRSQYNCSHRDQQDELMVQQAIVGCRCRKLFSSSPLKHFVVSIGENNAFKQAHKKNRGRSNKYAQKCFPLTDNAGK